jgi:heme exporter protein C
MIWAKPTWGVWWTWDARLTLTAIMFFVYLGYLALRRAITDPVSRARRSAVLGMLAIVQVPIVHFSVIWWRGLHQPPTVIRPDEMQIDGILLTAVWVGVAAFTLVYAMLVRRRMVLAELEASIEAAFRSDALPVAGEAVARPSVLGSAGEAS